MRNLNVVIRGSTAILAVTLLQTFLSAAVPTHAQRDQIRDLSIQVTRASNLFLQGNYKEAAAELQTAMESYAELAEIEDEIINRFLEEDIQTPLVRLHANLEIEGLRIPPLDIPGLIPDPEDTSDPSEGISFVNEVAPILIAKCGRCHVSNSRGDISMASYTALMESEIIQAGIPSGSEMIKQIESGDMPKGDGELLTEEYESLFRWISQGARFDGADADLPLANLAAADAGEPPPTPPTPEFPPPRPGDVSFTDDIASILADNCMGCHGDGNNDRGGLRMESYARLMRGGDSGAPILPGNPAESLLIGKLKGTAEGDRMPMGRPPLSDETIEKIAQWITRGAQFDGPDEGQLVTELASIAEANNATGPQLSAQRAQLAAANWNLCMPTIEANEIETEHFLIVGTGEESTLEQIGQLAEAQHANTLAFFHAPQGESLVKGRMTIFVFDQRYDYSEFGNMVERRQLPSEWRGHWKYSIIDAYAVLLLPRNDAYSLEALLGQQIAGVHIASLGNIPLWFSEGAARLHAQHIDDEDARITVWDESLTSAIAQSREVDDFINGEMPPELGEIVAYGFLKKLRENPQSFNQLLNELREGAPFEEAFTQNYRASPAHIGGAWVANGGR